MPETDLAGSDDKGVHEEGVRVMTAAECLSQLTDIRRRIEALNETIAKCYSSASKSTPSYGGEAGGEHRITASNVMWKRLSSMSVSFRN